MRDLHEQTISKTLSQCARSVTREAGPCGWHFILSNGHDLEARARIDEEWLMIHAPLPKSAARVEARRLLQLNARLSGLSKFALLPGKELASLCAELPLDEEIDLGIRLQETCDGFKAAFDALDGDARARGRAKDFSPADARDPARGAAVDLRQLCADAGWSFKERAEGALAVDLEVRGEFFQALVEGTEEGGALISVELVRFERADEQQRQCGALTRLLLKVSGIVRLARPAIEGTGGLMVARYEVRFETMPRAAELNHALAALSVACAVCGQEARALQDTFVANNYLKSGV